MSWARWSARAALCVLLMMSAQVPGQAQAKRPAAVDDQEARDLFRLGTQAFDEGRFERALKYFKDAYELSGRAQLQYDIGSVLDRLRRDREAIEAYRSYLAQTPDANNRSAVEERIRLLEDALAKSQPPAAPALTPIAQDQLPDPNHSEPATASAAPPSPAVPTPAETARAAAPVEPAPTATPPTAAGAATADTAPGITSRWWFWTAIGAGVVGAAVLGVALGTSSAERGVKGPAVLGASTRVRPL